MGIKERRERQRQATREAILAAAREIARSEGWDAVTIRRVAARIEYSAPVIYEYFQSKDDLLAEIQRQGFELLADMMRQTAEQTGDKLDRLFRMADVYWRFAHDRAELYRIMHGWESASLPLETTFAGANIPAGVVLEALQEWATGEGFALSDPDGAVEVIWALMHGMISIETMGRTDNEARSRQLCFQAMHDLFAAWKARNGR